MRWLSLAALTESRQTLDISRDRMVGARSLKLIHVIGDLT